MATAEVRQVNELPQGGLIYWVRGVICKMFHSPRSLTWPVNGKVTCLVCGMETVVEWGAGAGVGESKNTGVRRCQ